MELPAKNLRRENAFKQIACEQRTDREKIRARIGRHHAPFLLLTALWMFSCILFPLQAYANTVDFDELGTQVGPVSLGQYAEYWQDETGKATLESAISRAKGTYQPLSQITPHLMNHKNGILWLKIRLPSLSYETAKQWQIVFDDHRIEKLTAVQINRSGSVAKTRLGRTQKESQPVDTAAGFVIPISPSYEPSYLYISVRSDIPVLIDPYFAQTRPLHAKESSRWFSAAIYPTAIFMAWLCYLALSAIRHRGIPAILWTLGPVLMAYAWINTPLSHGSRLLGSGWTWQIAITTTPLLVGLIFISIVKNAIEKSLETHREDQLLAYTPLLFLIVILANLALPPAISLIVGWALLCGLALWSVMLLQNRANTTTHKGANKLLITALLCWLPLAFLEIGFATGLTWLQWPRSIIQSPLILISEVLLFLQIELSSIYQTDRQIKRLRQSKKSLSQTLKNLEISLEVKNRFFQRISQDIAKQLNALSALDKENDLPISCRKNLEQLRSLSRDIQRFCEIEAGCLKLTHRPFGFKALIETLTKTHMRLAKHKGLDFKSSFSADIPETLIGDPEIITQLLGHLLDNAIRYTASGEVEMKVSVVSPQSEQPKQDEMMVMITITDTGPGLPEHLQQHFYGIAENEKNTDAQQLGVGLTTCRHMVELMQGEIHITSLPNKGTTCFVSIPLKADTHRNSQVAHKRESAPQPIKASSILGKAGVQVALIVTSDSLKGREISAWLSTLGYKALTAKDATLATDLATQNALDIILIFASKSQPSADIETITALRKMGAYQKTPILAILPAEVPKTDAQAYSEAGATQIILQPLNEEKLEKLLQRNGVTPKRSTGS